jgi:hypothetical protein
VRGRNVTLIAGMSPKYGVIHHMIINETTKGKTYAKFICDMLKQYICQTKNMIIVQDNAKIHKTDEVNNTITYRKKLFLCTHFLFYSFF